MYLLILIIKSIHTFGGVHPTPISKENTLAVDKGNIRNVVADVCFGYLSFYNKIPRK